MITYLLVGWLDNTRIKATFSKQKQICNCVRHIQIMRLSCSLLISLPKSSRKRSILPSRVLYASASDQ